MEMGDYQCYGHAGLWDLWEKYKFPDALFERYGIDDEIFYGMLWEQGDKCAICRRPFGTKRVERPMIDHCHRTNTVRNAICHGCNVGLGNFLDDAHALRTAAAYCEAHAAYAGASPSQSHMTEVDSSLKQLQAERDSEDAGKSPRLRTNNPYRARGYTATLHACDIADVMNIAHDGVHVMEVFVTVMPEGPGAKATVNIKRFAPGELPVRVSSDFSNYSEKYGYNI